MPTAQQRMLHRAWLNTEGLPEQRADQYQPLADRWIAAAGKMAK